MKKLAKQLIEFGLNPRLLNCGFIMPSQVIKILQEFLPYTNVTLKETLKDSLIITIDFHDFSFNVIFKFETKEGEIHYIRNIDIE